MNQTPRDLGTLRRSERIGGLLYLPMFLIGTQLLAFFIVGLFWGDPGEDRALVPINLIYTGLNAAVLCVIFRHYLADQFRRFKERSWHLYGDLMLSLLLFFGLSIAVNVLRTQLQELLHADYQNANQDAVLNVLALSPESAILMICVLAPLGEELLFRGLIFCGLYRKSRILAYALSIFLFSLVHVYSSMFSQPIAVTLVTLTVYLPHSFVLAWIYDRSGSIWSSIALHATLNAISLLLLGLNSAPGFFAG